MGQIKDRYDFILAEIHKTAAEINRDPNEITLIVVTKTHSVQSILEAYDAGIRDFGENYVEEAVGKMDELVAQDDINWHMIGHIQSRKTSQVVSRFATAQSIDRLKIARRLDEAARIHEKKFQVFLEFNVSGEESKFGWSAWDEARWHELSGSLTPIFIYSNLSVLGLMTMAPYSPDPEHSRKYFRKLRKLGVFLENSLDVCLPMYSMGMSGDFQVAIEEGATHLRIGTAIMGNRS